MIQNELIELIINRINTIKNNMNQAKSERQIQRLIALEQELIEAEYTLEKLKN